MKVLGLSYNYHDASAALVEDGRVVAAAAEERFSRLKHDPNFPGFAAQFCLESAGLESAKDLDAIVFYEEPAKKFSRVLTSTLAGFPSSRRAFMQSMKGWLGQKLWTHNEISRELGVESRAVEFLPHHCSHAAQAFLPSPFEEAAILTVDAVGEWDCTCLAWASRKSGFELQVLETIPYPHSLGLIYAAFTAFLGFRPNDAECSTMALAAFGRPIYVDKLAKVLRLNSDGSYEIDESYFSFVSLDRAPFTNKFISLFGRPRDAREKFPFTCAIEKEPPRVSAEQQRYADIAASVQCVLEDALLGLVRRLSRLTGSANLCLAGGVALNCVANEKLRREGSFRDIYIPPDPGDGGAAAGAALLKCAEGSAAPAGRVVSSPFLGKSYSAEGVVSILSHLNGGATSDASTGAAGRESSARIRVEEYRDEDSLTRATVTDLMSGRIVGWFQGRFESGPRGLGNRSLLVDPSNREAVRRLSHAVKKRASYRPYAISVTEEDCGDIFEWESGIPRTARWMQTASPVKSSAVEKICAAVHVDFTTRPQVCSAEENPAYHKLLSTFGEAKGLSALLNTSFNSSGYPIVSSPYEALLMFLQTDMDALVVNNFIFRKG